jgi:hypothetical protein
MMRTVFYARSDIFKAAMRWMTYHIVVFVFEGVPSHVISELPAIINNNNAFLELLNKYEVVSSLSLVLNVN